MEEWRAVVGFEGLYEVSSLGNVRRIVTRYGRRIARPTNRKLVLRDGYLQLVLSRDGSVSLHRVHTLVATAFLGPAPTDHEVNHIDGAKTRNCVGNLEWITYAGNQRHAYRTGLKTAAPSPGERNGNALLSEARVIAMREMARTNSVRAVATAFDVAYTTAWGVIHRTSWKHVA